ncbi:MAG: 1,4-dihydroxy-6-naphthoate synthase [Candidatus Eremiobacteraeota bacterium]|nr:1,4-dihydroxy-6-naphthoate synthase [Candidatus Eremiobacteraeota bacterium]
MRALSLAYSPCPNDTYVFAALTNGLLDAAPDVRAVLEDVESLNASARRGDYEITKVSYGAVPELLERYRVLRSGGALGYGCGPLLVTRPQNAAPLESFAEKTIAIPGERTTAFLLLRLALGKAPPVIALRFDRIVDAVAEGVVDAGLIIHESRFTYREAGLHAVADLGEWWEQTTGLPIPLGAILARRDLSDENIAEVELAIRRSLQFARTHEDRIMPYVREHAAETSERVMRAHIELYVNDFTDDLGPSGEKAVHELFRRAAEAGLIPSGRDAAFA